MKQKLLGGDKKYYVNSILTVALMFGGNFVPSFGSISQMGMGVLGVFLGTVYGWSTVGFFWPSALSIIALACTGYGDFGDLIAQAVGSNTFIILMTMFCFLGIINESGVSMYLAKRIIGLKMGKNHPWLVVYLLMTASCLLFGITGALPVVFMIWEIFYDMVNYNQIEKGKFTQFTVTAILFAAILGGQIFPFVMIVVVLFNIFTSTTGLAAPAFLPYVIWMLLISQLCTMGFILVGKYILKIKAPQLRMKEEETPQSLDTYQKIVLTTVVLFIVVMISTSILPDAWLLTQAVGVLGVGGVALLADIFLIAVRFTEGKSFQEYMKASANWEILFMSMPITLLAEAITSSQTGISNAISAFLVPIFESLGVPLFLILIVVIPLILTNFCDNIVMGTIFIPIGASIAEALGVNQYLVLTLVIEATSMGLATPFACTPAAVLHGNAEWITSKQAAKYGTIAVCVAAVVILVVGIPLGMLLYI